MTFIYSYCGRIRSIRDERKTEMNKNLMAEFWNPLVTPSKVKTAMFSEAHVICAYLSCL